MIKSKQNKTDKKQQKTTLGIVSFTRQLSGESAKRKCFGSGIERVQ